MHLFLSIMIFLYQSTFINNVGDACELDSIIKPESKKEYFSTWKKFSKISDKLISSKRNTGHIQLIYVLKKNQNALRLYDRRIHYSEGLIKNPSRFKKECDKVMKEMLPELQLMIDENERSKECTFLVYKFNIHYCI